jgi:putative hemolysin
MWGVELGVIVAMIAINGVFAGYELALASVSLPRLEALAQENRAGARAAREMKRGIESSLAAIQVGITLVGAVAAATGGAGAGEHLAPWLERRFELTGGAAEALAVGAVVLPITTLSILFGELLPKVFALRNQEWLCLKLSPAMRFFALLVHPAVWLFERAIASIMRWTEPWRPQVGGPGLDRSAIGELRASATLARALRAIGKREEEIILAATTLPRRRVHEIMLRAEHISMLHADASLADALLQAHLDMHTRFPVTERPGDPQQIVGYVNFKDIVVQARLAPGERSLRGILRSIPSLAGDAPIGSCLETLMRQSSHIALVRDAAGVVLGMITLEDILEELVGDIEDEYDRLPTRVVASGPGWVVGGGVTLARLREATGLDLADSDGVEAQRLTDWVCARLGGPVRGGELVEQGSTRLLVRKVRRQQVQEAYLAAVPAMPGLRALRERSG